MLTTISTRVDSEDKKQFEELCENLGLNVSVAINIYIKKAIRDREIPVVLKEEGRGDVKDKFYSISNMKALDASIEQIKNGQVMQKTVDELEEIANG